MTAAIVLILAYSVFAPQFTTQPIPAGTYQSIADNGSIIRMDTRTGTMERCSVVGNVVTCQQITAAQ